MPKEEPHRENGALRGEENRERERVKRIAAF